MQRAKIRVLLVDDSALALAVLQRMLATSSEIEVVGTASNGREALALVPLLQPSVICTGYHMPLMNGLEFTQQVMALYPRPILVVSSAVGDADRERVFALLEAGAVDVFAKPRGGPDTNEFSAEQFIKKVKIVAGVWVWGRTPKHLVDPNCNSVRRSVSTGNRSLRCAHRPAQIVAMGASTGGPQALLAILSHLPDHFSVPILCVQHISTGFLSGLVSWLNANCPARVQIANEGEIPRPGRVYFPVEGRHLHIDCNGRMKASKEPPVDRHRPSISVTFRSVAEYYGDAAIGVLLTGMGRDGGEGMQALSQAGALTIAQDEATCVIYGMPRDAVERGAACAVLSLADIPQALIEAVSPLSPVQV